MIKTIGKKDNGVSFPANKIVHFTGEWFRNNDRDYLGADKTIWILKDVDPGPGNKFRNGIPFWETADPDKPLFFEFTEYQLNYASPGFNPSADTTLRVSWYNNGVFVGGDNFGSVLMVDDETQGKTVSVAITFSVDLRETTIDEIEFFMDRPTSVVWDNGNPGQSIVWRLKGRYLLP